MKKALLLVFGTWTLLFSQSAWINEFHYDNSGSDVDEMVEVVLDTSVAYNSLSDFSIDLYNGNGGASYNTKTLDQFTRGNTDSCFIFFYYVYPSNGLQNGNDGICLSYQGTVLTGQFISYEGSFTAIDGPANGMTADNLSVSESSGTTVGYSLQLSGEGTVYSDFTWQSPAQNTAGALNNGQIISHSTDYPPVVSNVARDAKVPDASSDLTVTADVTDDNSLSSVTLHYQINGGTDQPVVMSNSGGDTYSGVIPASAYTDGDRVTYSVTATDDAAQSTSSQTYGLFAGNTNIANIRVVDVNGDPVYQDFYVQVTGVATVSDSTFSQSNLDVYMQDATGGINIFKFGAGATIFAAGNSYTVVGPIDSYLKKMEIVPDDASADITDNGSATPPTPVVADMDTLATTWEAMEGMLVTIANVDTVAGGGGWPSAGQSRQIQITDDNGVNTMIMFIDSDTDIDESSEGSYPLTVTGVLAQYNNTYEILPRSTADLNWGTSAIEEEMARNVISEFKLHQNYPNPFNPTTRLTVDIAKANTRVELAVYNVLGKQIGTLYNSEAPKGQLIVEWNGTDMTGHLVPSGIYFATVKAGDFVQTIKMMLMK